MRFGPVLLLTLIFSLTVHHTILSTPEAQRAGKIWRIGYLSGGGVMSEAPLVDEVSSGPRQLGCSEG